MGGNLLLQAALRDHEDVIIVTAPVIIERSDRSELDLERADARERGHPHELAQINTVQIGIKALSRRSRLALRRKPRLQEGVSGGSRKDKVGDSVLDGKSARGTEDAVDARRGHFDQVQRDRLGEGD